MIVPNIGNIGGGGAVRHIQRGFISASGSYSSQTIALSGFKNLDKMFVEAESGISGAGYNTGNSAHISEFSLTSMTLSTEVPVMYQVIEFS